MKRTYNQTRISFLLVSAFVFLAVNFGASAQETKRQGVSEKPTPTPVITATPSPTTSPTPYATPTSVPVQTLSDLQSRIRLALSRPELRRGTVAVKIASLDTGKTVFEENADKYVMPASNMKNFTVAAALERLSPNFRFATSVYADSLPDAAGTIKGDLRIYGRGDVSLSNAFYEGDYLKGLDSLADKIVQAGVKRVEGNLVGDESYFSGNPIPASWEWDDLQWRSGAEVSALPINDNTLDLSVKPGSTINSACFVQLQPFNSVMKIVNRCQTSATGAKRDLTIKKALEGNVLEISGTIPTGDKGFSGALTVSRPAELFVSLLKQRLQEKGVIVTGQTQVVGAKEKSASTTTASVQPVEITRLESPPFNVIAAKTMKPSQNLYTETILWTLGEQFGDKTNPKSTSAERGSAVVRAFLQQIGIPSDAIVQWDGSGLSRHNLVTANANVQLYTYMAKQSRYAQAWRDSLTIGGTDGTLQNRFKGTSAAGNVRGKTGTIDQVSALSGYVTTASGEPLVFSIIVNGVPATSIRTGTIDDIVVALSNYNGKIN
ncbi:MAG TPA: D-alanyl-D-alanine carboxypeptidase/D-alanyl-D-alanine-endopeptidase [Pyrinomonadaceae bacterium]|jgi:D-alanyl-D-alanine carboxypeptidase/D-alanyl-D-alanine-endopeptidase (penicillin-binding protein 4)